jgi:hypothetical protein
VQLDLNPYGFPDGPKITFVAAKGSLRVIFLPVNLPSELSTVTCAPSKTVRLILAWEIHREALALRVDRGLDILENVTTAFHKPDRPGY